jgi:hypothetical protein
VFETTLFFDGMDGYASESVIEEVIELLEYPEMPQDDDISIEDLLTTRQRCRLAQAPATSASRAAGSQVGGEAMDDASELSELTQQHHQQHLPTPGPSEEDSTPMVPEGYRRRGERALQDVNLDLNDTGLIILGKRNRKPRDLNNFAMHSYAARLGAEPLINYLRAFSTQIPSIPAGIEEVPRIHQSQLPPPPKTMKQLNTHMFSSQFRRAQEIEWRDLRAKGVFRKTDKTKATADGEVLPLM